MRIIGGQHRGAGLASVGKGDQAAHLRPTTDRVRESLFNILLGGRFADPISNARVLDLFAGTGALGLEALSRGAKHVTFVDDGKIALKLIRDNISKLRRNSDCAVLARSALKLPAASTPCELVFLDPPYGKNLGGKALIAARSNGWLEKHALIVWEEGEPQNAPEGFEEVDSRKFGDTYVTFLRAL